MSTQKNFNFSTQTGRPIYLDGGQERGEDPAFYIDVNNAEFSEKAIALMPALRRQVLEDDKRLKKLDNSIDPKTGLQRDIDKIMSIANERFDHIKGKVDELIGQDAMDKIFKDTRNEQLMLNFLEYLSEMIREERSSKKAKYNKTKANKVL